MKVAFTGLVLSACAAVRPSSPVWPAVTDQRCEDATRGAAEETRRLSQEVLRLGFGGLRGGGGQIGLPHCLSRDLSALHQGSLKPDDLWPSSPPPCSLDAERHGYLREDAQLRVVASSGRIPRVLHRCIFLGTQRSITEPALQELMHEKMREAYTAWVHENEGFRFELHNLEQAEAYIAQHYQPAVLSAFRTLLPFAFKTDLFRYLVLYNEGGWYVDLKLGLAEEMRLSLDQLLLRLAAELSVHPEAIGFVGTGQNMVWNVEGAEGIMNAFLGAKPRHPFLGDTIIRVVDACNARLKGLTPWSLTGPYALFVGVGKRRDDGRQWRDFQGQHGAALLRFGFDEWHLPVSDAVVVRKAARGECGGGWSNIGGNNYVDMWFENDVFGRGDEGREGRSNAQG